MTHPAEAENESRPSPGFFGQLRELSSCGMGYWLVNMANFTDGIAYFGILNLLVLYLTRELHMADARAGLTVSLFTGMVTILMVPGGSICDRWGTRRAIGLSLLLGTLGRSGLALAAVSPSPWLTAWGSLMLMAAATGVQQPALYAGVKETTHQRVAAMGFSLLYSIMNLGIMAESFVSPWLRTHEVTFGVRGLGLGFSGVLWVMAGITLFQLVIHSLFFPADPVTSPAAEATGLGSRGEEQAPRKHPLLEPRFIFFIFILLPVRTLFAHQWLTIPDYIFRCFDEAVKNRYEWFAGLNPLVVTLAVPLFTHWTRRVSVLKMMIVGTAVSAAATFLLVLPPRPELLISYVVLFSLGEALWASRFLEYIAQMAPPGQVGAYMGVANLPWFVAKFTTGFYSGWMIARFLPKEGVQHPETLWLVYACFACLSPIGLMLAYRWLDKSNSQEESSPS